MAEESQFRRVPIGLVTIRRARAGEADAVRRFVQRVANDVYGELVPRMPVPIGESNWSQAWVALSKGELVAVLNTANEWVDNLWVVQRARRAGLGERLLRVAEQEIKGRGFRAARLTVVSSNLGAVRFYTTRGWREMRRFPHALLPVQMSEMRKTLDV